MDNQMPAKTSSAKTPLLPVWLWFWLGVYITSLPGLISYLIYLFHDVFAQYYTWSVEVSGENSFFELLRVINLYEIAAYILVLIGVVSILFAQVRGRHIERKYKLTKQDGKPAIQEVTSFVRQYVPHLQVKANLLSPIDQFAIIYPLGFRKPALGIFNKLIMLWRSDRKTAEAILMHEIAHVRQGDTIVLGAGSLFKTAVSYRRILVEHSQAWWVIPLLIIFYPLMFLVRPLVQLGIVLSTILMGLDKFAHYVSLAMNTWAGSALPVFIAMTVWLLLWKWLEPWWDKFFTCSKITRDRSYFGVLALSAVVLAVVAFCVRVIALLPVYPGPIAQSTSIPTHDSSFPTSPKPIPTVSGNYYKIGQVFQAGNAQVIVLGWETLTNSSDLQGTKDKKIIRVEIAVRNNGRDTIAPLVSCARLKDVAGNEYHFSVNDSDNSIIINRALPSGAPKPGEKIHGIISFLVNQNSDGIQFIYIANPPQDMTRSYVALTDDTSRRISPPETLPESNKPFSASLNQALLLKDFTVTVTKVWTIDSKNFAPDPGNKLIALDLTIKNTSNTIFKISNIFSFELDDENGITYSPGAIATAEIEKKLPASDLAPGQQVSLSIGFELPETLKKAWLQYILDNGATIELEIP